MKNKHIVLIERDTDFDSGVIGGIKKGPDIEARVTKALEQHFDGKVTDLKLDMDEFYRGMDIGYCTIVDEDGEKYDKIFDIYPLWIY